MRFATKMTICRHKSAGAGRFARRVAGLALAVCLIIASLPQAAAANSVGYTTSDVILRTKASASSVPLATIRANREIVLLAKEGEWYKVKTGDLTGYVLAKYVKEGAPSSEGPAAGSSGAGSTGSTTQQMGGSSSALHVGDKGSEVQALQKALKNLGFFSDEVTGNFGPVTEAAVKAYQAARGMAADGIAGNATLAKIALEGSTSSGGSTSAVYKKGDEGENVKQMQQALKDLGHFTDEATGFFGVKTEQALIAFQKAKGLTADGVAGSATLSLLLAGSGSSSGSSSSSVKKGDKGAAVSNLQTLLRNAGFYTGTVDGDFGEGTEKALIEYQKASGLTADGVAGSKTITLLSSGGSSGSGGSSNVPVVEGTESLGGSYTPSSGSSITPAQTSGNLRMVDWWSGEIDSVYPRKAIAQMLDVRTGISLNIYRMGGTNHLDFEPATAADTELFRQISGGSWSWSARPVILIVGGTRYAAAINTMPHGEYHITDNNFDGQCCMHFVNSWTHGGKKPNDDMQMQIMVAYNSGK